MSEDRDFERFGKYLILDHLVDGGMAKICRARFLGEQADKIVAIKMVQAQYSKDPAFVQMFEDELKVTFGLQHPNIAQMYDYGKVNGQLYTAMELVDGANLKQYQDRLKEKNFVFPVEISTYIISQVCQALQYAHTFTDKMSGKKLNIIHRDISPHNIMLTYDGAVKVIDFGIAKADSNSESTQAGTIKGKLSYLAPEYLDGLKLDPRYDEFAVGITLWEMLCNRKLFTASNDLAVLKQIQACKIPAPSTINPHVPKELDQIVLKALSKDRNQRYEDMDKFNRALVRFLYSNYPDFNATDLVYFSKQLFKEEIIRDRKKFKQYGKIDISQYLADLKSDKTGTQSNVTNNFIQEKKVEIEISNVDTTGIELNVENILNTSKSEIQSEQVTKKKIDPREVSNKTRTRTKKATSSKKVRSTKRSNSNSSKNNNLFKFIAASLVGFVLYTQFTEEKTNTTVELKDTKLDRNIGSTKNKEVKKSKTNGIISLIGLESDMDVYIDGNKVSVNGFDVSVPLNKELSLQVRKIGHKPFKKDGITLTVDDNNLNLSVPTLDKEKIGLLSTSQNFTTGSKLKFKFKDGFVFEKDLPIENERIPAGVYEGTIENPLLGTERDIQFEIIENKKIFLE